MKNIDYMINLLMDIRESIEEIIEPFTRTSPDDGGASEESMVYYQINCPYYINSEECHCKNRLPNRDTCIACKMEWLFREIDL